MRCAAPKCRARLPERSRHAGADRRHRRAQHRLRAPGPWSRAPKGAVRSHRARPSRTVTWGPACTPCLGAFGPRQLQIASGATPPASCGRGCLAREGHAGASGLAGEPGSKSPLEGGSRIPKGGCGPGRRIGACPRSALFDWTLRLALSPSLSGTHQIGPIAASCSAAFFRRPAGVRHVLAGGKVVRHRGTYETPWGAQGERLSDVIRSRAG